MARATGAQIRAIAATAVQETLRRKVLYVIVFLVLLVGFISVSSATVLRMVAESGEKNIGDTVRASLVSSTFSLWVAAAQFLALFLGAVGLSSETGAKTIVNVLSRPVDRSVYLIGRWTGLLAFLWGFQLAGIVLGLGMALAFRVPLASTLWIGLAGTFVQIALLSGVSLGLSVVMPPILAGGCAVLLQMLPALVQGLTHHPRWFIHAPAIAIYYLSPADMPVNLISASLSKQLLHPQFGLYGAVLAENLVYGVVVFAFGCLALRRREMRLR
jgi:ABC-type transport system involved in multi-copper enzyme maturation permease subunit